MSPSTSTSPIQKSQRTRRRGESWKLTQERSSLLDRTLAITLALDTAGEGRIRTFTSLCIQNTFHSGELGWGEPHRHSYDLYSDNAFIFRTFHNRYVLAIRDRDTDKITFKDASVIPINRTIKSLKNAKGPVAAKEQVREQQGMKTLQQHVDSQSVESLLQQQRRKLTLNGTMIELFSHISSFKPRTPWERLSVPRRSSSRSSLWSATPSTSAPWTALLVFFMILLPQRQALFLPRVRKRTLHGCTVYVAYLLQGIIN